MPFDQLRLIEPLLRAVRSEGYTIPTAIQQQAIPQVLEGKDLLGCAQTGTGKTAAFALPILQRLHRHQATARPPVGEGTPASHAAHGSHSAHAPQHRRTIRSLILTPTRELAAQIGESFGVYGQNLGLRHTVIFGGVGQGPQTQALRNGIDILVATPGRLLDLVNQRHVNLSHVEIFVLDEADRMLDMGFIHDIRKVVALLPATRQTLLFSATMPREIRTLAEGLLHDPVTVTVETQTVAVDTIEQGLYHVHATCKPDLLVQILQDPSVTRALVFTRTKRGADRVARRLTHSDIVAEAIHSDKSQGHRLRVLDHFKKGKVRVLIASDIASRGLDVDDISHVINYDLPNDAETYVHRIGRTGRAGAEGKAISFCSDEQRDELRDIERLLGSKIPLLHHTLKPNAADLARVAENAGLRARQGAARNARGRGAQRPAQAPQGGSSGSAAHQVSSQGTSHHPRRPASPQQQKNNFWRSRRRPTR